MKCPFCAEQILPEAKKCRHCGEWLDKAHERAGTEAFERGSADARAVTKGIKQQKQDEQASGCGFGIVLFVSIMAGAQVGGFLGWIVGIGVFIGGGIWLASAYTKE